MILVVQMYNIFRLEGGKNVNNKRRNTRMILLHVQKMYKTCTEDVQYIKKIKRSPSEHAPVRGCQNKRLGGTIGYYYDKGGL